MCAVLNVGSTSFYQPNYYNYNQSWNNNYYDTTQTNIWNNFNNYGNYGNINNNNISQTYINMYSPAQRQPDYSQFFSGLTLGFMAGQAKSIMNPTLPLEEYSITDTRVWGDPHYEVQGKDGKTIKFDHKGEIGSTYNVFAGDGYEVAGTYADAGNKLPIIGSTSIKAGADNITYNNKGQTRLNGKRLKDGSYDLNDGTVLSIKDGKSVIESREKDSKIELSAPGGAITVTPTGDFAGLDGIMGTASKEGKALTEKEANQFKLK